MPQTAVRESIFGVRRISPAPNASEIDAMLNAVNAQWIQHDLAPESSVSPEAAWTVASLAVGGAVGGIGAALLIGGWLAPLAAGMLGAAVGGVFAVMLWRASDDGGATSAAAYCHDADDDLLSGW